MRLSVSEMGTSTKGEQEERGKMRFRFAVYATRIINI
jgi:hypothetical protein